MGVNSFTTLVGNRNTVDHQHHFSSSTKSHHQNHHNIGITTCLQSSAQEEEEELKNDNDTTAASTPVLKSNIFHSYEHKPIVILGNGKEVSGLGYLLSQQLNTELHIVSPLSFPVKRNTMDVFVVDDVKQEQKNEEWTSTIQDMYRNQELLMIYVNVEEEDEELDSFLVSHTDYEVCIRKGDEEKDKRWNHLAWELIRLVARAFLPPAVPGSKTPSTNTAHLTMGPNTFFLSLSFPEITDETDNDNNKKETITKITEDGTITTSAAKPIASLMPELCEDVDAMEYRVDLLTHRSSRFEVLYGMQLLREYCRPHALRVPALPFPSGDMLEDVFPIVYTVRTANQAGTFPDDTPDDIRQMFDMLSWGLRSGSEVVDIESNWDKRMTLDFIASAQERYSSQLLGSYHVLKTDTTLEGAVELFQQCQLYGHAHGAKLVLSIDDEKDDSMAYRAGLIAQSLMQKEQQPLIPCIGLILGEIGQFSRILNQRYTPVTHEALPFPAAPGQLTASQIMATRILMKFLQSPQHYCILGHNIDYSVSPQMHNAAFAAVQLPYQYVRADVEKVKNFINSGYFKSDRFKGCSVTIPHKQTIMQYCDELSPAAKAIGSVNTIIVKEDIVSEEGDEDEDEDDLYRDRLLLGDNTDWQGMYRPLARRFAGSPEGGALIVGAGGTARAAAYAVKQLGLHPIVFYNRTPEKAQILADEFGGRVLQSMEDLGSSEKEYISVVISTLPHAANFTLPSFFLEEKKKNKHHEKFIILDVNYKPYTTHFIAQIEHEFGDDDLNSRIVRGSEMLWEQGVGQFELWTERTAPYAVMKNTVLQNCLRPPEEKEDDDSSSAPRIFREPDGDTIIGV